MHVGRILNRRCHKGNILLRPGLKSRLYPALASLLLDLGGPSVPTCTSSLSLLHDMFLQAKVQSSLPKKLQSKHFINSFPMPAEFSCETLLICKGACGTRFQRIFKDDLEKGNFFIKKQSTQNGQGNSSVPLPFLSVVIATSERSSLTASSPIQTCFFCAKQKTSYHYVVLKLRAQGNTVFGGRSTSL